MKNGKGLLALLGVAAGAFAFWQYKKMSPEKKEELKSKFTDAGRKLKEKARNAEDTLSDKFDSYKSSKQGANNVTN